MVLVGKKEVAKFHQYSIMSLAVAGGPVIRPVAIVEYQDGSIGTEELSQIQFIDGEDNETSM
jgi:hypothetical protein